MNYRIYKLNTDEKLKTAVLYIVLAMLVSYLFYDSIYPALLSFPLYFVYVKQVKDSYCKKRLETLKNEFCEMIGSLSDSLSAGLSIENAFSESKNDMVKLFGDDSLIVKELEEIIKRQNVNSGTEAALRNFADRADVEDISNFSVIFTEVKKSGGNLKEVIKKTTFMMREKMAIESEIEVLLKGKVLEQKIMSVIPFVIIVFLKVTCGDFMDMLYHNVTGIFIMSICLLIYASSIVLSMKIVNITV